MMLSNVSALLGLMHSGTVRRLGVISAQRHPGDGRVLPSFEITSWGDICGPAGMPQSMVENCVALTEKAPVIKASGAKVD